MASARLLLFITASASAQFVFFGNQHGPARSLASPQPPQPAAAPAREGRLLVQQPQAQAQPTSSPVVQRFQQRPAINSAVTVNSESRFAPTFFRPLTKLHHPGKNALPESDEPAKFVKILSDPDLILTEEGGMRRTTEAPHMMEIKKMIAMMEKEREGRLVVEDAMVSLPQFVTPSPAVMTTVVTTTTPAPTTTSPPETTVVVKTMAPLSELERTAAPVTRPPMTFFDMTTMPPMTMTTTTQAPTTTPAPVTTTTARVVVTTAKPMMKIVSSVRSSPFTLGTPRVTQLNQSPRMSQFPIVSSSPVAQPAPAAAASRAPKALPASPSRSQVKGNHEFQGKNYLLTWRMGRNNFDWTGGVRFCQSQGMQLVSLDNKEKTEHFLRLLSTDRSPYFWSGGQVSRDSRTLTWPSGKSEPIARGQVGDLFCISLLHDDYWSMIYFPSLSQHPWSFTGRTGPQPDGGERCLAVLNNTYRSLRQIINIDCLQKGTILLTIWAQIVEIFLVLVYVLSS